MTKGILGAVIGSIPAVFIWILLGYLGFTSTLIAFVMVFGVIFCYHAFGGIRDMTEIIICSIVMLITIYVGEHLAWSALVYHNYAENANFSECVQSLYSWLDLYYIKSNFISSVIWSYLFAFITFWVIIISDRNINNIIKKFLILVIIYSALGLYSNGFSLWQMRNNEILDCKITFIDIMHGDIYGKFIGSNTEELLYNDWSWQKCNFGYFNIGYTNRRNSKNFYGTQIKVLYDNQNGKIINFNSTIKYMLFYIFMILISCVMIWRLKDKTFK